MYIYIYIDYVYLCVYNPYIGSFMVTPKTPWAPEVFGKPPQAMLAEQRVLIARYVYRIVGLGFGVWGLFSWHFVLLKFQGNLELPQKE